MSTLDRREVSQAWFILPLLLHPREMENSWFSGRVKQFSPGSPVKQVQMLVSVGVPIRCSGLYPLVPDPNSEFLDLGWRQKESKAQFTHFGICWLYLGELSPWYYAVHLPILSPPKLKTILTFFFPAETNGIRFQTRWETCEKSNLVVRSERLLLYQHHKIKHSGITLPMSSPGLQDGLYYKLRPAGLLSKGFALLILGHKSTDVEELIPEKGGRTLKEIRDSQERKPKLIFQLYANSNLQHLIM